MNAPLSTQKRAMPVATIDVKILKKLDTGR
jgi:hypothetical protein